MQHVSPRILTEIAPTALGFLGFYLYRRFSADAERERAAEKAKGLQCNLEGELSNTLEPEPATAEDVSPTSEPEPGPEPDLSSDESSPEEDTPAPGATSPASSSSQRQPLDSAASRGRCRHRLTWRSVAAIGAYSALTVAVFVARCTDAPGPSTSGGALTKGAVHNATSEKVEIEALRLKLDLPLWEEEEQAQVNEVSGDDNFVTLALERQFMKLAAEGQVTYYKSAYWGTLNVGMPAQTFKVVFDTGSGHLILPSHYCHSETCRAHTRYKRTKSTTAKDIDYDGSEVKAGAPRDQITVSFGTGEVTGVFVEDLVCVNESTLPAVQQPNKTEKPQGGFNDAFDDELDMSMWDVAEKKKKLPLGCVELRVVLATEMSEDPFKDFHFDGVLGLGLPGLSQAPAFNFPSMMAAFVADLDSPSPTSFGVFLGLDHEVSEITIGGWPKQRQAGPLFWSPVLIPEHGHWLVSIKNVYVDGKALEFCKDGTCRGVADTGTSLLAVPPPAFPEIYELLRHMAPMGGFCHGDGPALEFELTAGENSTESFTISMRPEDYASLEYTKVPPSGPRRFASQFFKGKGWPRAQVPPEGTAEFEDAFRRDLFCKPLLMSMDLPEPIGPKLFILGEPMLRRYYTVYDHQGPKIGWARAAHTDAGVEAAGEEPDAYWEDDEE